MLWKYYLLINLVTLAIWGWDKYAAIARLRRIPEKTLLLLIALGGLGGSLLGMAVFHHKTRHGIFYVVPLVVLVPHLLLASWIVRQP